MNGRAIILPTLSALSLLLLCGAATAGSLNPPLGPVQGSMKPLNEVEPRTAVGPATTPGDATSLYIISQPGSYYLTGNLTGNSNHENVIMILADGVTLDLNGFTIDCAGSQVGIEATPSRRAITIVNGTIASAGTTNLSLDGVTGVHLRAIRSINSPEASILVGNSALIEHCAVVGGTAGFTAGRASTIRDCTSSNTSSNGFYAISSTIDRCTARSAGEYGFSISESSVATNCIAEECQYGFGGTLSSRFVHCTAFSNTFDGFTAGFGSVVDRCTAEENGDDGITANDRATVLNSNATRNARHGIVAETKATITGNSASNNGLAAGTFGAGIFVQGSDNKIDGNSVISNEWGIRAEAVGNLIIRNTATGNVTFNYSTVAGNSWGTTVIATTTVAQNGSGGFGGLGATDPFANLSY